MLRKDYLFNLTPPFRSRYTWWQLCWIEIWTNSTPRTEAPRIASDDYHTINNTLAKQGKTNPHDTYCAGYREEPIYCPNFPCSRSIVQKTSRFNWGAIRCHHNISRVQFKGNCNRRILLGKCTSVSVYIAFLRKKGTREKKHVGRRQKADN